MSKDARTRKKTTQTVTRSPGLPAAAAGPERKPAPRGLRRLKAPADLEIDPDALEFIAALDAFRKKHNRPFPTWSEVLYVLKQLGYKRT
ncbi:MAG: hypothetical protein IT458_11595 [Planctomycetes bacterium]|nr:hypothetical protein [Planctomycetota bacterium]